MQSRTRRPVSGSFTTPKCGSEWPTTRRVQTAGLDWRFGTLPCPSSRGRHQGVRNVILSKRQDREGRGPDPLAVIAEITFCRPERSEGPRGASDGTTVEAAMRSFAALSMTKNIFGYSITPPSSPASPAAPSPGRRPGRGTASRARPRPNCPSASGRPPRASSAPPASPARAPTPPARSARWS